MNIENTITGAILIGFVLVVLMSENLYNKWRVK